MNNIMDYLAWRGDLTFSVSPLNEVDSYILSQISAVDFSSIVPRSGLSVSIGEAAEAYDRLHAEDGDYVGVLCSRWSLPMLRAIAATERFSDLRLAAFRQKLDPVTSEQFAAVTVLGLPGGARFVSFRGTDDTIAGWKENFRIGVENGVPAQLDALGYLREAADAFSGKLYVGGHSKGGNLAVYAAASLEEERQSRIVRVFSHDGPGFLPGFAESEGYRRMSPRLSVFLPQSSLVGTLLEQDYERSVLVKSDAFGPAAHDGFTWEVSGTAFVRAPSLSLFSRTFDEAMNGVLGGMDTEERREFVDAFFEALTSTGAVTLTDLTEKRLREAIVTARSLRRDKRVQEFVSGVLGEMLRGYVGEARAALPSLPQLGLLHRRRASQEESGEGKTE